MSAIWVRFAIAMACAAASGLGACSSDDAAPLPAGAGGEAGVDAKAETGGAATDAGTGGSPGSGGTDGAAPKTCKKIVVKGLFRDPEFGKPGENYSALVGTPDPTLGSDVPDEFQIQLYEFTSKQAPGVFDLSIGKETNFSTCSHCLLVLEDLGKNGEAAKYYFQESGELTLSVNPTPTTGEVKGTLKNARLVEVTIDYAGKTYKSAPVPGGACLEVDSLDIDTLGSVADAAAPCDDADCGVPDAATD